MSHPELSSAIEQALLAEKRVEVADLVRRLGASEVAVRKELAELETRGFCLRTASGAVLAERPEHVVPYIRKSRQYLAEKEAIAAAAAARIKDGETIVLDAGSTTLELARRLRRRDVYVLTNSLPAADLLAESESVRLTVIGGTLRRASLGMVGPLSIAAVRGLRVDQAFLGAAGFDPREGFSSFNLIESQTKTALREIANQVCILADATKFERPAFSLFAPLDKVNVVITDREPSAPAVQALAEAKVELVVAQDFPEPREAGPGSASVVTPLPPE